MIYFLGDIHGDAAVLHHHMDKFDKNDVIIQVGDWGFYPRIIEDQKRLFPDGYPCPVYVIDGNHENFNFLFDQVENDGLWEFIDNMFYVPRGTVMEIDDYLIGFLGGACSVDIAWRKPVGKWYAQETITENDLQTLISNVDGRELDVLVTHAAPAKTIQRHFKPLNYNWWGLPKNWVDYSSKRVERAIDILNPKQVVCGHMHKSVNHKNVRILDINEFRAIDRL